LIIEKVYQTREYSESPVNSINFTPQPRQTVHECNKQLLPLFFSHKVMDADHYEAILLEQYPCNSTDEINETQAILGKRE
jgi:hypothetical protein